MTKNKLKVCWISAGISSFMAGYLANDVDEWIYIDIADQHPDSMKMIEKPCWWIWLEIQRGSDEMQQITLFDIIREPIKVTKPIRLIELFAG